MSDWNLPKCTLCGDELGRQFGSHYNCRENWRIGLERLASNLAIGAALCRADALGGRREFHASYCGNCSMPPETDEPWHDAMWSPGCGKAAP